MENEWTVSLQNVAIEGTVRKQISSKCDRNVIELGGKFYFKWSLMACETLGRSFSLSGLSLPNEKLDSFL